MSSNNFYFKPPDQDSDVWGGKATGAQSNPSDAEHPTWNASAHQDHVLSGVWNPPTAPEHSGSNHYWHPPQTQTWALDDPIRDIPTPPPADPYEFVVWSPPTTPEAPLSAVDIARWDKTYAVGDYVAGQNHQSLEESAALPGHAQPGERSLGTGSGTWRNTNSSNPETGSTTQTSMSYGHGSISSSQARDLGGPDPYRCDHCDRSFPTPGEKRKHLRYLKPHEMKHACTTCKKRFVSPGHRNRHEETHATIKKYPWPCPDCRKAYTLKYNLMRHQRDKQHFGVKK